MTKMTAAILGVGTEITSGQIHNSNAQWISKKLKSLGIETHLHLAIPDDHKIILESLQFAEEYDFVFVTGGLGPTSDDFTRDVVAKWAKKEMIYDEESFRRIEERLKSRNVPVRDAQKQQCYFPKDSKILLNNNGTANAFYFENKNIKVFVLPGPPKEISRIWDDHIAAMLASFTKDIDAMKTISWDCLGPGESEISHWVETVTKDCEFEKGYRVHFPYVEVKLTYPQSRKNDAQKWIDNIEKVLNTCTVARNGEDLAEKVCAKLANFKKICICDNYLHSYLAQRLMTFGKPIFDSGKMIFINSQNDIPKDCDLVIQVQKLKENSLQLKVKNFSKDLDAPAWLHALEDRKKFFFTETIFVEILKVLN